MSGETVVYTGKVKWFNNKSGYGFITVLDESEFKDKDIFAHHSSICINGNLYKYLVQGEYVNFNIQQMAEKNHEQHAVNISGIMKNDLMCETRFKNKDTLKPREEKTGRVASVTRAK